MTCSKTLTFFLISKNKFNQLLNHTNSHVSFYIHTYVLMIIGHIHQVIDNCTSTKLEMLMCEYGHSPKQRDKKGLDVKEAPQPTSIIQKLLKNMAEGYKIDSFYFNTEHTELNEFLRGMKHWSGNMLAERRFWQWRRQPVVIVSCRYPDKSPQKTCGQTLPKIHPY